MSNIISDIATLVKAGFTMSDIKEVINATNEAPKENIPEKAETESKKDPEPSNDEPDYKALYEKAQKDLNDLQAKNTKDDISPEPLQIDEIIKSVKSRIC